LDSIQKERLTQASNGYNTLTPAEAHQQFSFSRKLKRISKFIYQGQQCLDFIPAVLSLFLSY
jgi:hypothetical protein